jgi:hypothetical protein
MAENNNETSGSQASGADASTPEEKAVVFVNTEVLSPPPTSPMTGAAKIMIDQSTGMMVQDLQSFLKGFEQVGLIALSRLASNLLTYGSPVGPPPGKSLTSSEVEKMQSQTKDSGNGNEMMKDLFKIVSDYAEAKTKISSTIYNNNPYPIQSGIQNPPPFTDVSAEEEDPEKKNE